MADERVVLASAARTATLTSADMSSGQKTGLYLLIDVTAVTSTPSVVLTLQAHDDQIADYFTLFTAAAALTAVSKAVYYIGPGAVKPTTGVTEVASIGLPPDWRVSMAHADTDSITYSITAQLVI